MFTRFNPHARSFLAMKPSIAPLVVIEMSFKSGTAAIPLTMSQISFRISGSPPVSLILEMPKLTAIFAMRKISSTVISSAVPLEQEPSSSPSLWQ
jgi:hypothetical protein